MQSLHLKSRDIRIYVTLHTQYHVTVNTYFYLYNPVQHKLLFESAALGGQCKRQR